MIERARSGDADSFARLVATFERPVYVLALQKLGHPEDAEDAVQDAFLEAYRTLDRLQVPEAFPGWIRKIVLSHCFMRLRRRRPRPIPVKDGLESPAALEDPFSRVDPQELPGLILQALSRVPEGYQLPLMMRYVEKLPPQRIAEDLAMNASTVRVTLHRGSQLLRKHLEDVLREKGMCA